VTSTQARLSSLAAEIVGRQLSGAELDTIYKYLEILTEWNRIHRLVGSDDRQWLVDNVVLDSLLFLKVIPPTALRVLDVGSGAGIPGVPLKIVRPEIDLVMVEARRKRASFLSAVIRTLGLVRATVVNARIEALGTPEIGIFDTIVARCTAEPARLFGKVSPFLSAGGALVVSGPPKRGPRDASLKWIEVRNPVTGLMRNFAIMASPSASR
jgi:16S rRNA (guanine527-N7)-methyltransferase